MYRHLDVHGGARTVPPRREEARRAVGRAGLQISAEWLADQLGLLMVSVKLPLPLYE
jgi:hypothetical protein